MGVTLLFRRIHQIRQAYSSGRYFAVGARLAPLLTGLKKDSVKVLKMKDYVSDLSKKLDIVLQALEKTRHDRCSTCR